MHWLIVFIFYLSITLVYFTITPHGISFFVFSSVYYQTIIAMLYFTFVMYIALVISVLLYLLPNISMFVSITCSYRPEIFYSLNLTDITKLIYTLPLIVLFYHSNWIGPSNSLWFGHLTFTMFQFKVFYLVLLMFSMYLWALVTTIHISSLLVYDHL